MPPKAASGELDGGRRSGRGGSRGGGRGSSPSHGEPPTPTRSPGGPPQSPPQSGGSSTPTPMPASESGEPAVQRSLISATPVGAIGVRRPGRGTAGRQIEVITNDFAIELDQGTIHHYDGMYLSFSSKGFTKQSFPLAPPRCSR